MNIKADKMRYQPNKGAYYLILLGLLISIVALFSMITPSTIVPNFNTVLEIMINIIIMLITFLAAERCKVYSRNWALVVIVIAGIHVLRIFWVPTQLVAKGEISRWQFTLIAIYLLATAASLIIGALITIKKNQILMKHLKEIGEKKWRR